MTSGPGRKRGVIEVNTVPMADAKSVRALVVVMLPSP